MFPKPRRPAENNRGAEVPVLQQIDQREVVVKSNQSGVDGVQLITHQMMKRHSSVLGRSLDEPVEREPLLDLVLEHLGFHATSAWAFGGGVGRVLGQSGLKGSGSGLGCDGSGVSGR